MDCCVIKGCNNKKDQGAFVGNICSACYTMITTGDASIRSTNFINKLKTIAELNFALEQYYYWAKSNTAAEGWTFEDYIKHKINAQQSNQPE
jgi:hypothetical protein